MKPPPWAKRVGGFVAAARAEDCPSINITPVDKATKEGIDAILAANDTSDSEEFVFRYGDHPSRLEYTDSGQLVPSSLNQDRLTVRLNDIAWWEKTIREGTHRIGSVPIGVVKSILATANLPFPILERIVEVPVLALDGTIHDKPGYSPKHRVWYEPPNPELSFPHPLTGRRPTREQIQEARDLILRDLLGDFPFVSEAERAHALCLHLQPFMRDLIAGPTPLFDVEAPTPGSGKTLLVDVASCAAIGGQVPRMTEGRDEDEWRKRITARLRTAPPIVLIDNLQRALDSPSLSAMLTSEVYTDRLLGQTEILTLPNRTTWAVTGNNPKLSGEITRRVVRIRLDSELEHPEDRKAFRHPDLLQWAQEHRGELVWAALTLARAWVCAGRPVPAGQRLLGGYEEWSKVMGGTLHVAGVPGFLGNLDDLRENAGTERDDMLPVLITWYDQFQARAIRTKDLGADLLTLLGLDPTRPNITRAAGRRLGEYKDRPFGDYVLRQGSERGGVATWSVRKLR